jgi:NodT family efflux transporter outer membrane factor (OMF) lipoprotein
MKLNKFLLGILPIVLYACSYNSGYDNPQVSVHKTWTVPQNSVEITESNLAYMQWWLGFNDPLLNKLIESGLANNNTLNMSRGHVEAAEGELKKVQLQWIPDISMLLGYSNNPATGFPGLLAVLAPSYTMNFFRQFKEQKRANYELDIAKAEDDAVKLDVITQISAAYFTYLAEVDRKQLLQILADDISHIADISESIYLGGLSTNINLSEMRAQVHVIHGEQETIEQNIVVTRNALRYLINQNPGDIEIVTPFNQLNNSQLIPGQLPMTVLENRPDMQMAKFRLKASNEGIGIAASALLPTLQLDFIGGPVAGNNKYNFPSPLMTNAVDFNDQLLQVPILRASALGDIDKAKGLDKISYYHYIETLQNALKETTNALSANYRLTKRYNQTESAQRQLTKAYNLNDRLYKRGIQSNLELLRSKVPLDRVSISLNQDKLQQLLTVVNLYHELAGGYKVESPVPTLN